MPNVIDLFKHMKAKPNLYYLPVKYEIASAFIRGYDCALENALLEGFREWLIMKLGKKCSLVWPGIVLLLAFPENQWAHCRPVTDHRLAIDKMFEFLLEFLEIKKDRDRGLRWIYAQYEEWDQEWEKRMEQEYQDEMSRELEEEKKEEENYDTGCRYDEMKKDLDNEDI